MKTKKHSPQSTRRLLNRIRKAGADLPPTLVGMEFVRFVRDPVVQDRFERDFAWSVYISHNPCHDDGKGFVDDRNTVITIHRLKGTFKIIGRELPRKYALKLARGLV